MSSKSALWHCYKDFEFKSLHSSTSESDISTAVGVLMGTKVGQLPPSFVALYFALAAKVILSLKKLSLSKYSKEFQKLFLESQTVISKHLSAMKSETAVSQEDIDNASSIAFFLNLFFCCMLITFPNTEFSQKSKQTLQELVISDKLWAQSDNAALIRKLAARAIVSPNKSWVSRPALLFGDRLPIYIHPVIILAAALVILSFVFPSLSYYCFQIALGCVCVYGLISRAHRKQEISRFIFDPSTYYSALETVLAKAKPQIETKKNNRKHLAEEEEGGADDEEEEEEKEADFKRKKPGDSAVGTKDDREVEEIDDTRRERGEKSSARNLRARVTTTQCAAADLI